MIASAAEGCSRSINSRARRSRHAVLERTAARRNRFASRVVSRVPGATLAQLGEPIIARSAGFDAEAPPPESEKALAIQLSGFAASPSRALSLLSERAA